MASRAFAPRSGAPTARRSQYAAGRASFRHLTLDVDERVLIPRPETELLIDIVLDALRDEPGGIAVDVGTGSGAIALALANEGRFDRVIGTDVSLDALAVARANATRCAAVLRAPVELRAGSLLGASPGASAARGRVQSTIHCVGRSGTRFPRAFAIGSPPSRCSAVRTEWPPRRDSCARRRARSARAALLAIEVDMRRASLVAELVATHGAYEEVRVQLDLTGRERFVVARRREAWG